MQITLILTLKVQQELYSKPRDFSRFGWYLEQLTGQTGKTPGAHAGEPDVVLPITAVNPMGREHCLHAIEALIEIDAETAMQDAIEEASRRLGHTEGTIQIALNLVDDDAGGWTDRYFTEARLRFGSERDERAALKRRFVIVPCWTSETYRPEDVRKETLAAVYRRAWRDRFGLALTLGDQVVSEGAAMRFACATPGDLLTPAITDEDMASAASVISSHFHATGQPTMVAAWFGDAAASNAGYPELGLAHRAGFAVALAQAERAVQSPEGAVTGQGTKA